MFRLKKFGSFYIGGRDIRLEGQPTRSVQRNSEVTVAVDSNGDYTVEAMYVQYFLPTNYKEICVLIHGGGHTGAIWETTPDGREGWLQLLLKQGIAVYIIDSVERGRAGWCSLPNIWSEQPEQRTHQRTWEAFRFGSQENFKTKTAYLNQQFPIEYFTDLVKYDVPRWNCNANNSAKGLSLLLNKIGKCSLIAHSQGADIAIKCYNLTPQLIQNIVLIEPAAFPEIKKDLSHKAKILMLLGDHIELSQFWGSLKKKAIAYLEKLQSSGISCKLISLPSIGILGNSHMMMMDKNNSDVLQVIVDFLNSSKETASPTYIRSKL